MAGFFRTAPGVDVADVHQSLLTAVEQAVRAGGGVAVYVTSGFRDPSRNTAAGGVSRSNHLTGDALDGYAVLGNGRTVPLGTFLKSSAARFGLRSGDTPGFFNGRPDPVHVDDGANVSSNGSSSSSPAGGPSRVWSTELLILLGAPRTPANYKFLNQWFLREHARSDLTGQIYGNNPFFTTAGAGGSVGPLKAGLFPRVPASVSPGANKAGVAMYPNLEVGVYANAFHIANGYPAIHAALKSGNPGSFANNAGFQQELTTWSGGGYSGFASIPAPSGPVGQSVNAGQVIKDAAGILNLKPVTGGGGPQQTVIDTTTGAVKSVLSVGEFLGKLSDPSYILRGLQILAGGALVGVGIVLLAKQIALAADLPTPPVAGAAAAAIE